MLECRVPSMALRRSIKACAVAYALRTNIYLPAYRGQTRKKSQFQWVNQKVSPALLFIALITSLQLTGSFSSISNCVQSSHTRGMKRRCAHFFFRRSLHSVVKHWKILSLREWYKFGRDISLDTLTNKIAIFSTTPPFQHSVCTRVCPSGEHLSQGEQRSVENERLNNKAERAIEQSIQPW